MNDTVSISKKTLKKIILLALVLIVVALGYHLFKRKETGNHTEQQQPASQSEKKGEVGKTGPAPAGHAHGLPGRVESTGGGPVQYTMSEEAKMLAEVQTAEVKRALPQRN